jgi:hypothetical protein
LAVANTSDEIVFVRVGHISSPGQKKHRVRLHVTPFVVLLPRSFWRGVCGERIVWDHSRFALQGVAELRFAA